MAQRIMNKKLFIQLKEFSIRLWNTVSAFYLIVLDKIKYSPRTLHYMSACAVGIGLARLIDSGILAYISLREDHALAKDSIRRQHSVVSHNDVDVLSMIGGSIYTTAPAVTESPEDSKSQINYSLVGTLEGHPSFASAVIQILEGDQPTKEYLIGSKIGQDTIAWIGRGYITVRRNGKKIKIKVGQNALEVIQKKAEQIANLANLNNPSATINKTISRQDVLNIMKGNASSIYQGASFGPDLKNGKIIGYKIHRVKPTHIFFKLGARNGDVVRKMNGFELNDTERMFELWKSIKTAGNVNLELERNGKLLTYNFRIIN